MKILGVGSPLVDVLANVEDNFLKNINGEKGGMELVDISVIEKILSKTFATPNMVPGGSAANTILALTKLGVSTGFLGKIGDDKQGKFYINNYEQSGGDIRQFKISRDVRTGQCLSLVTPDSQRTMRTYLGAAITLSPNEVNIEDFYGYTHLHVEGYTLQYQDEYLQKILRLAKQQGLIISIDLASFEVVKEFRDILPELLKSYVDVVFCNEDEAMTYCGSDNPEDIFKELGVCCDVTALKLGKNGAIIKTGDVKVKVDANVVDAIDSTGAGDLWQAGFLYAYVGSKALSGKLLEKAGGFGSILGAEVVQIMGACISDERWIKIRKQLV
jgi:sugar/nucleoside kinase (ribokinase family)